MSGKTTGPAPAKRRGLLTHLAHPSWQGVGAVIGAAGVLFGVLTYIGARDGDGDSRGTSQPSVSIPATTAQGTPGPEPSREPSPPPTPTASAAAGQTFLDELDQVEGHLERGERKVNGRVYAHALSREIGSGDMCGDIDAATAGFDLDRRYSRFRVVAGLSQDASSAATAHFKVYGDGRLLKRASATLSRPAPIDVPVTGVLRLRLVANTNICQYGDHGEIVWADPALTP